MVCGARVGDRPRWRLVCLGHINWLIKMFFRYIIWNIRGWMTANGAVCVVERSDAACLRQGRFEGRVRVRVQKGLSPGASFRAQATVDRTRGTARVGCALSPPGFSPRRRGYGGRRPHPLKGHRPLRIPSAAAFGTKRSTHAPSGLLPPSAGHGGPCPHPLKGHRPLRIPFAAAFRPKFRALPPTHKDGRLLNLSLPSSPCPSASSLNTTKRPRPLSVGRGRVAYPR